MTSPVTHTYTRVVARPQPPARLTQRGQLLTYSALVFVLGCCAGLILGVALAGWGAACELTSTDHGVTVTQTCVRDVSP